MSLRTCVFDLGNVLVRFSHDRMCAQVGDLCGRTAAEIRPLLLGSGLQWRFERGHVTPEEFHAEFEQAVGRRLDPAALRHAASDIFEPQPGMRDLLDALKSQGLRLVLLSNTSTVHFEFISRAFDVLEPFDAHVLSFEVGAIKPEPAIFAAASAAAACAPHECFYTDDIPEYVAAGRAFGWHAEVFTDPASLKRHLAGRGLRVEG